MSDAPVQSGVSRRGWTRLLIGGVSAVALVAAGVVLTSPAHAATQICSPQTGTNGGNYFSFWNNGQGTSCITLNSGTSYTSSWSNIGDWVGGVGWNPGSTSRSISYSASLQGNGGTALMALYGWSTSPLVYWMVYTPLSAFCSQPLFDSAARCKGFVRLSQCLGFVRLIDAWDLYACPESLSGFLADRIRC